jgi:chromate transporter
MMIELFIRFFLIGAFTIGGGLATIPHLIELSQVTGWFDEKFLITMIAISESTPGPIGINMATVVGVKSAGLFGGLVASVAVSLAGIGVMLLIAPSLTKYRNNILLKRVLKGLKPTMLGLILSSAFILWTRTFWDLMLSPILLGYGVMLIVLSWIGLQVFKLKSFQIILLCALCGWGLSFIL